jgi:transposase-like protein
MARFGGRLERCEGAYQTIAEQERFLLDPASYAGGVALWGAVEPVYNTTKFKPERGVHVHARRERGRKKDIDRTFAAVEVLVRKDLLHEEKVLITRDTAVAYYLSRFLRRRVEAIFCPHCRAPHLDSDWFAVKPHRTHLCHNCHRTFRKPDRSISNPLSAVQLRLGHKEPAAPRRAKAALTILHDDYPGGLQIWASNPALLWTSNRAEEQGIHVHGWTGKGLKPKLDGTFSSVTIDGVDLNEEQLRYYMAQSALAYLRNKIRALKCPRCDAAHFDKGEAAFRPANLKTCENCGHQFVTAGRRLLVSNPFVDTLRTLRQLKGRTGKRAP